MLRFSAQGVAVVAGADVALQVLDVRGGAIGKEPLAGAGAVCRGEQAARARGAGETVAAGADVCLQVLDVRGGAIGKEPLAGAGAVCRAGQKENDNRQSFEQACWWVSTAPVLAP